ncbi:Transcription initiation protein, partial [Rasamsonia emersonii CBS 393.64]
PRSRAKRLVGSTRRWRSSSPPRIWRELITLCRMEVSIQDCRCSSFHLRACIKHGFLICKGVPDPNETYTATTSTKPSDLCSRFCNLLDLPYQVTNVSMALSDRVTTMGDLAGRSPLSIVAACIYMASYLMGHGKTAKEISQVAHVSDGTIRGAYKQLYAERERLIDPNWIKDGKGDMANLPAS